MGFRSKFCDEIDRVPKSLENHSFVDVIFNCLFTNVTLNHIKMIIGLI